jgi:uroporphyrinogen III methyltransferase/synthase
MELSGRTILITRAVSQIAELSEGLARRGARVLECPLIEIVALDDWTEVDAAIARLPTYQWLLFTSMNAVDSFMARVKALGAACDIPIAAVGPSTARRIERWGRTASLIAGDFRAEGLLDAFPVAMNGVRVLFPRAREAREILPEELRRRGAAVDVVTVYRTETSAAGTAALRPLLAREAVDCLVLTSPSAVRVVVETLQDDRQALLGNAAVAVIGPVARDAAESAGLTVTIQPKEATIPALIDAITRHFCWS